MMVGNRSTAYNIVPRTMASLERKAYPHQQRVILQLEGYNNLLTTAGGGTLSAIGGFDATTIAGWSSRFGNTFDEYRVLSVRVRMTPVSINSGLTKFWFDEKSNSAPTYQESIQRTVYTLSNNSSNPKNSRTFTWKAKDLLDLEYQPINSSFVSAYFKIYTDNANYGSAGSIPIWLFEPIFIIEFRGIKST